MIEIQTMQQEEGSHHHHQAPPSPSFSSYSSETLAEIAARVIEELRRDTHSVADDETLFVESWENDNNNFTVQPDQNDDTNENDDDFEFAFVLRDPTTSPVSADDIFYNGQIKPMYPIFDRNLLFNDGPSNDAVSSVSATQNHEASTVTRRRRLPLRKLMFEEGETTSCSSSTTSEAEDSVDLDGVNASGSYCVWTPNSVGRERKKSNSTGSASKRWKLRDLFLRSHSEGKEQKPVVFQVPVSKRTNKVVHEAAKPGSGDINGGALAERDGKDRTVGTTGKDVDGTKKKSFLAYRPELVGLFANGDGLGRNLHPF